MLVAVRGTRPAVRNESADVSVRRRNRVVLTMSPCRIASAVAAFVLPPPGVNALHAVRWRVQEYGVLTHKVPCWWPCTSNRDLLRPPAGPEKQSRVPTAKTNATTRREQTVGPLAGRCSPADHRNDRRERVLSKAQLGCPGLSPCPPGAVRRFVTSIPGQASSSRGYIQRFSTGLTEKCRS